MSDIVKKLRDWSQMTPVDCKGAADEIERLLNLLANSEMTVVEVMADNERLRTALHNLYYNDDKEAQEQAYALIAEIAGRKK